MGRLILNDDPGTIWTNSTGKVQYQFIANWSNTCGVCAQLDHAIGPYWPIPLHRGCRCQQRPIAPGKDAKPFVDFMAKVEELDHAQQSRVVGRANLTLIDQGVVEWSDVVTKTRVRDFREVVALKKLRVEALLEAGVDPRQAKLAHDSVHTPAQVLADEQRKRLIATLSSKGVSGKQVGTAVSQGLAARVGMGVQPPETVHPAVARHLGIKVQAPAKVKAKSKAKAKEAVPQPVPARPTTANPIVTKLEAYTEGDRKVQAIAALHNDRQKAAEDYQRQEQVVKDHYERYRADSTPENKVVLEAAQADLRKALTARARASSRARQEAMALVRPAETMAIDVAPETLGKLPADLRPEVEMGLDYLRSLVAKKGVDRIEARFGLLSGKGRDQRDYYDLDTKVVNLTPTTRKNTVIHEMGHLLEHQVPGWNDAAQAFLRHRVGDEKEVKLNTLGIGKYDASETGRKDQFEDVFGNLAWYVGKPYGYRASEITAMGLEKFSEDPIEFARKDPEYVKFLIGMLDGSLR